MPCDTIQGLTEAQKLQRERDKTEALRKVEQEIMAGRVKVIAQADGTTKFEGWPEAERSGFCDACAYRRLAAEGSSALRMGQARSQATPDRMARKMGR